LVPPPRAPWRTFEEGHVRAVAADGELDGERAVPVQRRQRLADQRRLAVAARRDEEDFLAGREVADQALELHHPVDEPGRRHDLAVDEGILGYVDHRNGYG
jgi:4'-phosphopantetheinyl transferase EntD